MNYRHFPLIFSISAIVGLAISCSAQTDSSTKDVVVKDTAEMGEDGGDMNIEGSSLNIQPGTMAVGSKVSMAKIDSPNEFSATDAEAASIAVAISAKNADGSAIESVAIPMTIALDFGNTTKLLLAGNENELCVLLKATAGLFVWRYENLVVTNSKVELKTLNFGIFQVVYCGKKKLAGFNEATKTVTGESGNKITMIIPSSSPIFGQAKYCMAALRFDIDDDKSGSSNKSDDEFDPLVIASSEAPAVTSSDQSIGIEVAQGDIQDDKEYYVVLTLENKNAVCPMAAGQTLSHKTKFTHKAFFAFFMDQDSMKSGFEGSLHAKGPFATKKRDIIVGRPDATSSADIFAVDNICVGVDLSEGGKTYFSTAITTSGIGPNNKFSIYEAVGNANGKMPEINAKIGGKCDTLDSQASPNPQIGMPYFANFYEENLKDNTPNYLTPVNLHVSLPLGVGCIRIYKKGAIASGKYNDPLGETLIKLGGLTTQLDYKIYLPLIDPAIYDMQITLMEEGKTCKDTASTTLSSISLKDKTLTSDIYITPESK